MSGNQRVCLDFVIDKDGNVFLETFENGQQYLNRVDDLTATEFKNLILTDINDSL